MTLQRHLPFGAAVLTLSILLSPAASGHGRTAPHLDEANLDGGLYVAVKHPRVVRDPGPFDLTVILGNPAGEEVAIVEEARYFRDSSDVIAVHQVERGLAGRRDAFQRYCEIQPHLKAAVEIHDRATVERLSAESRRLLEAIAAEMHVDRCRVGENLITAAPGAVMRFTIQIDVRQGHHRRTIHRKVEIPVCPALPDGRGPGRRVRYDAAASTFLHVAGNVQSLNPRDDGAWFAGDQHLHCTYSLDALVLHGTTEDATDYAQAADVMGLDWIIITDHSNVHTNWLGTDYYTPEQFNAGTAQAAAYTTQHDFLALYGEEMGLGSYGFWDLPSHMLALPHETDSTGYLENPSSGLLFNIANCEPEQVIIDRINNAGGLGFIAHPFDSGDLAFVEWNWDNGATGWAGLEIFSDTNGAFKDVDQQSFDKWHELLNGIAPPENRQLAERPGFPTAFPVGLGNSDAHEPGLIGKTFTYAFVPEVTREEITSAFVAGRCVATNGPLLFGRMKCAGSGDVALLMSTSPDLEITLQTTPEFGPVGDYQVIIYVNGAQHTLIPPSGLPDYSVTFVVENLQLDTGNTFITFRADSADNNYHAFTNPVWLQFTCAGDVTGDEVVNIDDVFGVLSAWGTSGGPEDINEDGTVNIDDLFAVLAAWGPCP
ncbi:MAG: CehA/McbA family metallohydrolase [Phycisphaerales bacterium]|nr:MAG: CehA/McbA family metallohydrolase [Phycisphaerales bacterium]